MKNFFNGFYLHKSIVLIIGVVLLVTILFETGQQYYYVTRFNLADDVQFFYLFKLHLYKWMIWALLSSVLIVYTRKRALQPNPGRYEITRFGLLILSLVLANILFTSTFQALTADSGFSWDLLIKEYIPFLTFQKLPIYVLGYVFLAVMLYYYFTSKALQIKVLELGELKEMNTQLYDQLSATLPDKTTVLTIKTGQSQKIIPATDISWIEADDYCAKIHTKDQSSYVMRISLKALEQRLGNNFLRIHRKAIINIEMISELHSKGPNRIILKDQTEVPVAKSKLKVVRQLIADA
ncbi:MAG: LytTR family DNA-binding domain-containing protein [Bacteroidota bacterium]